MDTSLIPLIITALLGAGGLGAFATIKKAGKESESIATQTLIAVIAELRRELDRRDKEVAELRERVAILENRENERHTP